LLVELLDKQDSEVRLYPLSLAQQRLWFLEQLEPGTAAYNISSGLQLIGNLDTDALGRAVRRIVARHETLRTDFQPLHGVVFQRVLPTAEVEVLTVDLRVLADDTRDREAHQIACKEACEPFDLHCGPLLRMKLLRLRDEESILLFTMHHLISDAWSIGVFVSELAEIYESDIQNCPCQLPSLSIQYSDYAEWQRESLGEEEFARQSAYWKTRLGGMEFPLELPSDRTRPAEQAFLGEVVTIPAPAPLIKSLEVFAHREGTSLFTVMLAAFNVLLYRYTHQEDICIGVPVAGRRLLETEVLIGSFVNTLAIRTNLSGNPRFRDLLAEVRDTSIEAHANQDLPFEKIVEELQPKRSLDKNPIFQVMITALKEPLSYRRFGSLSASPYVVASSSSLLDVSLFVVETADGTVWWRFQYNKDLFDAVRIQRMALHYQTLLHSILKNPEGRIADLPLLTGEELQRFSEWNGPSTDYPKKCVHALIADRVARSPDRIAAVFEERGLTYSELHDQARRVAAALRDAAVIPGSLVAVCLERSLEMVVGVLAVLYSGAAYVPLDPTEPAARIAFKMADSGAALLLTHRQLTGRLSFDPGKHVLIEDALTMPPGNVPEMQDPESLAYVAFTSGSTGKPKGVCVPHRALVNLLSSMQRQPGLEENDSLLAVTNLCFDISALELFLPLIAGGRVVVASRDAVVDGRNLLENLRRHAITTMQATPSTWRMLIEAGWRRADCRLKVLCGGEALPAGLANELTQRSDSVWNLYGPTETTVWSSLSRIKEHCPVTIGRPIQNTQFYILDRRMRRAPVGIPGELYIGGDGLTNGYLNRPELTNERFVVNPFSTDVYKLYKTGDEVRYRPDGEIEYLGRLDFQMKVRGHRIEPGEVEAIAAQFPEVRQTLAMVREDAPGNARLVCYIVPHQGADIRASELRAAIAEKLPDYMVPAIVLLDSLPETANRKIDLESLPAPAKEDSACGEPRNETEVQLLAIWKQVLQLDRIGIADNFFDLGGHSLLGMRLLAEIDRVFGRCLPVATVFRAPTVQQMATILSQRTPMARSSLVTLQPHGFRPPLFLVPGADGNALHYADFARVMGSDQPVHMLQPVGFEGSRPLDQVEGIAKHFVSEIRKIQPRGPHRLAGFCVGGIVAFEMAQQLIASGEEPPLLALIETWHPQSVPLERSAPAMLRPWIFLAQGVGRHWGAMRRLPPREAFRYLQRSGAIVKEMILRRDVYRGDRYKRYRDLVVEVTYRAASHYVPVAYPGRILLFLAGNLQVEPGSDTRLLWCDLARAGAFVVRTRARDLGELLSKPHVRALAENLTQQLRELSTAPGASSSHGLI
jgi:amino acid adenylation domain-containing protein